MASCINLRMRGRTHVIDRRSFYAVLKRRLFPGGGVRSVPPCTVKEVETAGELALTAQTNHSNDNFNCVALGKEASG